MKTLVASKDVSTEELIRRNEDHLVLVEDGRPVALVTRLDDDDFDWLEQELSPDFTHRSREHANVKEGRTKSQTEIKADLEIVTD